MNVEKIVRNALTGALSLMVLGLMTSCSERATPFDVASLAVPLQAAGQECTVVDGIRVCSDPLPRTDSAKDGGDGIECFWVDGVLICIEVG